MKNRHLLIFSAAFLVILIDQISKFAIRNSMHLSQSIPVVKNIFHITYIQNLGAGFGILQQQRLFLILVSAAVACIILFYSKKIGKKDRLLQVIAGIVLGGTVGNLIDRIIYGYVIDFLDFRIWPVFNIADSAVTIGVILLIVYYWKK